MKTIADLKRETKNKAIEFKLVRIRGKLIPEEEREWRKILNTQTNCFFLEIPSSIRNSRSCFNTSKGSALDYPKSSLAEYTDTSLKIFNAGYRPLNEQEKAIMDEWNKITSAEKYKNQAYADMVSDGSLTYWQERKFFEKRNAGYLMGIYERGMEYDFNTKMIRDDRIKGELSLEYEIRRI